MPAYYILARQSIVPALQAREAESANCSYLLQWMTNEAQGAELDPNVIADLQRSANNCVHHHFDKKPGYNIRRSCAANL